jgi:hypothetical protein
MRLKCTSYAEQRRRWPPSGRHILAQYDDETVVVYQAYRPSIGEAAARDGRFGAGGFKRDRMTWIKPNFLWMMYRCGWGTKEGQEVVLSIGLRRSGFDTILTEAVHSGYVEEAYGSREQWQARVRTSDVRLQWDPDHNPHGAKVERRAIQLGLRHSALERYVDSWTMWIEDISSFVAEQRKNVGTDRLLTPEERVYPVADEETSTSLGVDRWSNHDDKS